MIGKVQLAFLCYTAFVAILFTVIGLSSFLAQCSCTAVKEGCVGVELKEACSLVPDECHVVQLTDFCSQFSAELEDSVAKRPNYSNLCTSEFSQNSFRLQEILSEFLRNFEI